MDPMGQAITVIRPGASVMMGGEKDPVEATVVSVSIDCSDRITYRCAWWDGCRLNQEWVDACLVRVAQALTPLARIGFANGKAGE